MQMSLKLIFVAFCFVFLGNSCIKNALKVTNDNKKHKYLQKKLLRVGEIFFFLHGHKYLKFHIKEGNKFLSIFLK